MKYRVTVEGKTFVVHVEEGPEGTRAAVAPAPASGSPLAPAPASGSSAPPRPLALVPRQGPLSALVSAEGTATVSVERGVEEGTYEVRFPGDRPLRAEVLDERAILARGLRGGTGGGAATGPRTVRAVMPGIVLKVHVEPGATVAVKDALLVLEAMKMQNELRAELAGKVTKVHVRAGQSIAAGAPLLEITPGT